MTQSNKKKGSKIKTKRTLPKDQNYEVPTVVFHVAKSVSHLLHINTVHRVNVNSMAYFSLRPPPENSHSHYCAV